MAKTSKQLATGAKKELRQAKTNPTYIFRTLNKIGSGKDVEAKEATNADDTKALYKKLQTVCGEGFFWSTIYTANGFPVVSLKEIDNTSAVLLDPTVCSGEDFTLIHFAGRFFAGKVANSWSDNTVLDAAAARLSIIDAYINEVEKEVRKAQKATEKAQVRKAQKEAREAQKEAAKAVTVQALELGSKIQGLKAQVAAGTITTDQAADMLAALMAA